MVEIKRKDSSKNAIVDNISNHYFNDYNKDLNILVNLVSRPLNKFVISTFAINTKKPYLIQYYKTKNFKTDPIDPNDPIPKDKKEIFKGIMTKFITKYFYQTEEITFNFFKLINDVYTVGLSKYITDKGLPPNCLQFIFKGGNILRLIIDSYMNDLPGTTKNIFKRVLQNNFKKSDADFQINIRNLTKTEDVKLDGSHYNEVDMNVINEEITTLAYLLLYRIRNVILNNLSDYIDYYKLDDNEKIKILNKLLIKLNNLKKPKLDAPYNSLTLKFVNISLDNITAQTDTDLLLNYPNNKLDLKDMYGIEIGKNGRKDFSISNNNNKISLTQLPYLFKYNDNDIKSNVLDKSLDLHIYTNNNDTNFYITVNTSIPGFNLVRMKISILVDYIDNNIINRISVPGEYIDVSIPDWRETDKFFTPDYISSYNTFIYNNDLMVNKTISFNSLSFNSIIDDLIYILFINSKYPWENNKYDVRINRLFMYYYVNLCKSNITIQECIKIISLIIKFFKNFITINLIDLHQPIVITNIKDFDIGLFLIEFNKTNLKDSILNNPLYTNLEIIKFINNILFGKKPINKIDGIVQKLNDDINQDDNKQFIIMLNIIYKILKLILKGFYKNSTYKSTKLSIEENKNELISLSSLSYNKYIKYKTKYLSVKKSLMK